MPDLAQKQEVVESIKEKFRNASGVVLADYRGLTVAEVTELRAQLREAGVEYRVLKNTMVTRAVNELGLEGLEPYLKGPTAIAFSADPVAPAKILVEYAKKQSELQVKAGVVEGKVISAESISSLAELPSREVLLSQVLAGMQAPLASWVNVLQAPIRKMGYALNDLRRIKESA